MNKRIKLDDPGINNADKAAVLEVLDSGYLVNGPKSRELEQELLQITGRKFAVAVSSGTTALLAAMTALGVGPGSKVIVPAFTFPAPASAAAFLGADVNVCDVDKETFCLTAKTLEPVLDDKVSLVIAVDQFGVPAPIPELEELLLGRNIPVLVDAACSIGSSLHGRPCGSMGALATFSFHPRKIVTTGEGGAVLTDDESLAKKIKHAVNHGMGNQGFESIGINLRMSEMAAAIGLSQVRRLDSIINRRATHAQAYKNLPIEFQKSPEKGSVNYQTIAAVLPSKFATSKRDELVNYLRLRDIEAGIAGYCLGAVEALANRFGIDTTNTPVALNLHKRGLALPLHTEMKQNDTTEVAKHVTQWLRENGVQ